MSEISEYKQMLKELGICVRTMRVAARMKQGELAKACGVSQTRISRLEMGKAEFLHSWVLLRRIADALGRRIQFNFASKVDHFVLIDGRPGPKKAPLEHVVDHYPMKTPKPTW
jgi:transcriptional regulator with XRE-family HTH domain